MLNTAMYHESRFARDVLNGQFQAAEIAHADAEAARKQAAEDAALGRAQAERHAELAHEDNQALLESQQILQDYAALNTAILRQGFDFLGNRLDAIEETLDVVAFASTNRLAVEADELLNQGLQSLRQGWVEEAVGQLERAVEKVPTEGVIHLVLGMAQAKLEDRDDAFESFRKALRYSAGAGNSYREVAQGPLAASAALFLKAIAGPEDREVVLAAIEEALRFAAHIPELLLAHAELVGNTDELRTAIRKAPELALLAASSHVEGITQVATSVHDDPKGPIQSRLKMLELGRELGVFQDDPEDVADALTSHTRWLLDGSARELVAQAERSMTWSSALQLNVDTAAKEVARAEAKFASTRANTESAASTLAASSAQSDWSGLVKPGLAALVALFGALAGGGGYFLALIGLVLAIKWGSAWHQNHSVVQQAQANRHLRQTDTHQQATDAQAHAAAGLDQARTKLEAAQQALQAAQPEIRLAEEVLSTFHTANTEQGRVRPLFM